MFEERQTMDESTNLFTVKAAWYYYIVGYTQSDIAEMLGLWPASRATR